MSRLVLVKGPAVEPLTVADARARLNIGAEVADATLQALITAARSMIDGQSWLGRAINTQTWDLYLDRFPGGAWNLSLPATKGFYPDIDAEVGAMVRGNDAHWNDIAIPLPPLQSITSVTYTDANNTAGQVFDPSNYILSNGEPSYVSLASGASWPSAALTKDAIKVRFIAGYGDKPTDVDERIRMAIALQVSHLRSLTQQNLFLRSESVQGIGQQDWALSSNAGDVIDAAAQSLLMGLRVIR